MKRSCETCGWLVPEHTENVNGWVLPTITRPRSCMGNSTECAGTMYLLQNNSDGFLTIYDTIDDVEGNLKNWIPLDITNPKHCVYCGFSAHYGLITSRRVTYIEACFHEDIPPKHEGWIDTGEKWGKIGHKKFRKEVKD